MLPPTDGEECVSRVVLGQPRIQRFDERVALLQDLILGLEHLQVLAALLLFQFLLLLLRRAALRGEEPVSVRPEPKIFQKWMFRFFKMESLSGDPS